MIEFDACFTRYITCSHDLYHAPCIEKIQLLQFELQATKEEVKELKKQSTVLSRWIV